MADERIDATDGTNVDGGNNEGIDFPEGGVTTVKKENKKFEVSMTMTF